MTSLHRAPLTDVDPQTDITEAMTAAFKQAQVDELPQRMTRLLDTVGPRVTAATLGMKDARMLTAWRDGDRPRRTDIDHRAQVLAEVVYAITTRYTGAVAASFLRSAQPALDKHSPLMLIRDTPENELWALQDRLHAAVRAFLEG